MTDPFEQKHRQVSLGLIAEAVRTKGDLSPYLVENLSGHVADGAAWRSLAAVPQLLDRLNPSAVTADALRSIFMFGGMPPEIAGVVAAHHKLRSARPSDAAGLRQLATSLSQGFLTSSEQPSGDSPWMVKWANTSSEPLHLTLPAHHGFVNHVCAVPMEDGHTLLASGGDDFLVKIWDPFNATPMGEPLAYHSNTVEGVCAVTLPGGRAGVASVGSDGIVCIWDVRAGRMHGTPLRGHDGTIRSVCEMRAPRGGSWVASSGYDGTVRIWDLLQGREAMPALRGHEGPVVSLAASGIDRRGPMLFSASVDGTVRRWTLGDGSAEGTVVVRHTAGVRAVCVLPALGERELIAYAGYDGTIDIVAADGSGEAVSSLKGHQGVVWGLIAWQENGVTRLLSSGDDATVREWSPEEGRATRPPFVGHIGTIVSSCVATATHGARVIASGGSDGTIRLWSAGSNRDIAGGRLRMAGSLRDVCVLHEKERHTLVTVALSGLVCFWDVGTGRLRRPPVQVTDTPIWCVCALSIPAQEARLAVGTNDGEIKLLDVTGSTVGVLAGHDGPVRGLAVTVVKGRTILASVGDDRALHLWDLEHPEPAEPLRAHVGAGTIFDVAAFTGPESRPMLATCADDGSVQLWDLEGRAPYGDALTGHIGPAVRLSAVASGPGGQGAVVSCGVDGTIRFWQADQRDPVVKWTTTHAGGLRGVAVVNESPERLQVASAGADGQIILHDLHGTSSGWSYQDSTILHAGTDGGLRGLTRIPGTGSDLLCSVGESGEAKIWHAADRIMDGEPLNAGSASQTKVLTLSSGSSSRWASIGGDGALRAWAIGETTSVAEVTGMVITALDRFAPEPGGWIDLVSGGSDGTLRWWGGNRLNPRVTCEVTDTRPVLDVCWLGGLSVCAALDSGVVEFWDLGTGRRLRALRTNGSSQVTRLNRVDLPGGGTSVCIGDRSSGLRLIDPTDGREISRLPAGSGRGTGPAVQIPVPNGEILLASLVAKDAVELWWPFSERSTRILRMKDADLRSLTPIGTRVAPVLAAGGYDTRISLIDLQTGAVSHTLPLGIPVLSLADGGTDTRPALIAGTARGILKIDLSSTVFVRQ